MVILFFLIFPETVKAEEEDQVGPQTQESPHDSSTDSCLTFPYSLNSPRPFPPSPVHSVSDSPKRVSPLPIATSNPSSDNSAIHSPIVHNLPTPVLLTPTINSYNTPPYFPLSSNSFSQTRGQEVSLQLLHLVITGISISVLILNICLTFSLCQLIHF